VALAERWLLDGRTGLRRRWGKEKSNICVAATKHEAILDGMFVVMVGVQPY